MDTTKPELEESSNLPPLSSSPDLLLDAQTATTSSPEPQGLLKRGSSVRFTHDTVDKSQIMGKRTLSADSDEIRPIRNADGQAERSYNTTEPVSQPDNKTASSVPPTQFEPSKSHEKASWWKQIAEKYGSITLENKGSVARDHLALERTFLAWLRTSLAFASIGIAITQLFRLNTSIQTKGQNATTLSQLASLPLAPMIGHSLPAELIPFLQQMNQPGQSILPQNTLLDQLLAQVSSTTSLNPSLYLQEFNEGAAQKMRRAGKPLGATFIGISIIVLLIGFHRYFEAQYWIIRGKFPASRGSISFVGLIAGAIIIASLVVVLVIAPVSYQKH